jgi:hypothetical protein
MANDRNKIFEQAKAAIIQHSLIFIEEVVSFLPISKPTFYEYFPVDSNDFNALKDLLNTNRVDIKVKLRNKWAESENPTLQISLYKLTSSEEELRRLSVAKQEVSGNEGQDLKFNISVTNNAPPITEED